MRTRTVKYAAAVAIMGLAAAAIPAASASAVGGGATDWMSGKWGIAEPYLASYRAELPADMTPALWNQRVNAFDVNGVADEVRDSGAAWLQLNVGQIDGYLDSPSATYESLVPPTAAHPSRLSTRDLIREMGVALHARGLKFIVYFPADPPRHDPYASGMLGGTGPTDTSLPSPTFQTNWTKVIKAWSQQWGTTVDGYWVDAARNPDFDAYYNQLAVAARAGNPNAIVGLSRGRGFTCAPLAQTDFNAGEGAIPFDDAAGRYVNCGDSPALEQVGALAIQQSHWGAEVDEPLSRTNAEFIAVTQAQLAQGGSVTWSTGYNRANGHIAPVALAQLAALKAANGSAGTFTRLRVQSTGLDVSVSGNSLTDGGAIVAAAAGSGSTHRFTQVPTSGGYVALVPLSSGRSLAVEGAASTAGALIKQAHYTPTNSNDEWLVDPLGGGVFRIQNRKSGLYLTQPAAAVGTQFVQSAWSNAGNQKFTLVP